jgi:hypothetical protein
MATKKQLEYLGVGVAVLGLYFLVTKPIPLCYISVAGICIVPNPILVFFLGTNPNFVIGWVGVIAGLVLFLYGRNRR